MEAESSGDIDDLLRACAEHGFGAPPVPATLRPQIRTLGTAHWGTHKISAANRYDLLLGLVDALDAVHAAYLSISHVGHGANSYFLSYQLVQPPLVLFLHTPWGGWYMDNDARAQIIAERFRAAETLLTAVMDATSADSSGPGRLVVVEEGNESDSRGFASWLTEPVHDHSSRKKWAQRQFHEQPPTTALRTALRLADDIIRPEPNS